MGRPSTLTQDLLDNIVGLIRLGNYPLIAARANGVSENTWYDWLARGREALGIETAGGVRGKRRNGHTTQVEVIDLFSQLVIAIDEAQASHEARTVGTLTLAAQSNDRTALALLERRYPARWRQHVTTEMVGPDGGPLKQELKVESEAPSLDDTIAGVLEALSRAGKLPKDLTNGSG